MRKTLALVALLTLLAPAAAHAQKVSKETITFRDKKRAYYLFVPEGLSAERPAPLVLLLHGSGRNGLSLVDKWKELAKKEGFVIAGPDSADSQGWWLPGDGPDFLHEVTEQIKSKLPVNPRRVYLFGHSAGANFALLMAVIESEYFAAAAVHAGAMRPEGQRFIDRAARKIPVLIQVGTEDPLFPVSVVRETRDAFKSRGFDVRLTEIPGHTHWYYDRAPSINAEAWGFLKAHELAAEPRYEPYGPAAGGKAGARTRKATDAYNSGVRRHQSGDLAGAVADYTRALEADPDFADALTNRAAARLTVGETAAALEDLTRSIALDPNNAVAYMNRGIAHRALKRPAEAVADHTRSLALKPSAEAFYNRAVVRQESGEEDLALEDYSKAILYDAKMAEAYVNRGLILLRRGRDAEAQADFDAAFRLNPALRPQYEPHIKNTRLIRESQKP
ncbi:MAG TPA: tetratricopeptide repeat protein [Pyrinomonadaceae bacterium]|nr:tetratricopeptide repeat protein [Pyrinomonadaceae bacterium]